jgi:hypothetical protein
MCGMSSGRCEASGTRGVEANPIFQENGQVVRVPVINVHIWFIFDIQMCAIDKFSPTSFGYGIISDQERAHNLLI